jgi:hypothetical protein
LCCVAIFVAVSTALPTGAPDLVCSTMTPAGPHVQNGVMEQTTSNPWMIDISAFTTDNGTVYTPGQSYQSKLAIGIIKIICGIECPPPPKNR